jgi:hypothetical protein
VTTVLRAVAAAMLLSLVLGSVALAADPSPTIQPTVGGTLSAAGKTITVFSNGNVPAHVTMSAEQVTLSETSFDIQPGQTHDLTFKGKATGHVTALYSVIPVEGADAGSAQLTLGLDPVTLPPPSPLGTILWSVLIALAVVFVTWRLKPWRLRLVRAA